eukprot:Sspe_Gene.8594::Locus_2910_Transcript_1_1_Confidence_1.000_Length_1922::g.8594::m.8594
METESCEGEGRGEGLPCSHHPPPHHFLLLLLANFVIDAEEVVNTDDGDRSLRGEPQGLLFAGCRLKHTSRQVVPARPLDEVQPEEALLRRVVVLRLLVAHLEGGDKLRSIECCVRGQSLRDDKESTREFTDGELLPRRPEAQSEVLEIRREGGLHRTTTCHHSVGLEGARDGTQRVVHTAVHLVKHVGVRPTKDDRRRRPQLPLLDDGALVIRIPLLVDLLSLPEGRRVEALVPLQVREGVHDGTPRDLHDALQVLLLAPPDTVAACLDKVLEHGIVNPTGGQDHVGPRPQDFLDALLGDVNLTLLDLLDRVGVVDEELHTHAHLDGAEVHVEESDLRVLHTRRHLL